jgi:methionyl aminopeptidase
MTEKQYGGATGRGADKLGKSAYNKNAIKAQNKTDATRKKQDSDNSSSENKDYGNFIKAGGIASEVVKYAKLIIKKEVPLLEIAEKIEKKISELGAKPAFPVNLSMNEIAAHDTPAFNDARKAEGLLKVDIGVHIDGFAADTAFSLDLESNETNKKLIEAAEKALKAGCEAIKTSVKINEVGAAIDKAVKSFGFNPIHNLSGHSIEQYELHSGITIPNYDNSQTKEIPEGVYAIEPFATNGFGSVKDGKLSGIYKIEREGSVRDAFARDVLDFIVEEFQTLPFCSRWIHKKFGTRGLLALRQIEQAGMLHHYPQLIESGKGKVSQAEHTIILAPKGKKIITTE